MDATLRQLCSREVPGDEQRGLQISPTYTERTFKHVLLPVWVLSYHYVGTPFQVLVNGYTGAVAGRYPKSWVKIGLLVLTILVALVIVSLIYSHANGGG